MRGVRMARSNNRLSPQAKAWPPKNATIPVSFGAWTLTYLQTASRLLGASMCASRADELLLGMVETTRSIYFNPHWVEWADAWLSGRDRSVVSAERILRRIRALQEGERQPDSLEDAERSGLRELRDLVATLPTGIAFAVTLAAADVAGRSQESQAALDAAGAMIKSYEYLKQLHGPPDRG